MVRSMWLFKHKFHADGTLSHYKARLVANGSSQQLVVDFDKTFSSVVKPATICTVLSLDVSRKWLIHQLDVKNAFLNGDLSETVYMHQPPGFVDARFPNHVCHLQRSLYGLKQAPSLSLVLLEQIIDSLHNEFDMTDLEALNYFLGISADHNSTCLFLSQRKYALQLLEHAHMIHCNPSQTPVDTESKLGPNDVLVQDPTLYRSLAGGLQYHTFTRPNLSYAVQLVCLYMHDPRKPHFAAFKPKCQHTLSRSSAKAEYRGVANVVAETAWLRNLLSEFHSPLSTTTLVRVLHVPSRYLYADILTKGLPLALFEEFRFSLSIHPPPAPTEPEPNEEANNNPDERSTELNFHKQVETKDVAQKMIKELHSRHFQLLLTGNTRQWLIAAVSSSKGVVTTNANCFINTAKSMNHRAASVLLRCASLEFLFENEEYFCGEVTQREKGIKVTKTNKHHSNISFGA
ncbi:ribonuclease H-like domain-containing protein [Tanacetum coccineum]